MGLIQDLKARYKGYKQKKFLQAHGCKTWAEYARRFDPDIAIMARWAHTYYHGYPYIWSVKFPERAMPTPNNINSLFDYLNEIATWCEKNCRGKWRNDFLRGFFDGKGNFELNEIGGFDVMFFSFKEESDYVWFKLVWQ